MANVLNVAHKRLCAGEVHRSLGVGNARKRKRKEGWSHCADGRVQQGFEGELRLPVGKQSEQPIATGFESEETAESIHFAPPLTCVSAMAQR